MRREAVRRGPVYSRADLFRILHITPRQLANWERKGLATSAEAYSFADLLEVKKVRDLCAMSVRPQRDPRVAGRHAQAGCGRRKASARSWGVVYIKASRGIPPRWQAAGADRRPVSDGFFRARESRNQHAGAAAPSPLPGKHEVASWFARGIALEEDPNTQTEAIAAYQQGARSRSRPRRRAHQSGHALLQPPGFRERAEKHYRHAIEADPRYALAYFDLGNVLDETGRVQEAPPDLQDRAAVGTHLCRRALQPRARPSKSCEPRKALKHWQAYVRLDTSGPWAVHARSQIKRILQADGLKLVYKRG